MEKIRLQCASNGPELQYGSSVDDKHRKKYAQFFTPIEIARFMCRYALKAGCDVQRICEPAFGLGIFSRILRSELEYDGRIEAFEIDNKIISSNSSVVNDYRINLSCTDYLKEWNLSADCIICNPPYLKFHDYDNLSTIKAINDKLGTRLNGYTNIYALFILKSLSELNKNGRAAYIVPSEFFNADYGVEVKRCLIQNGMLKCVVNFHFGENVFVDAITTATLLLFENCDTDSGITFFNIFDVSELDEIFKFLGAKEVLEKANTFRYNLKELSATVKWRNYYQPPNVYHSNRLISMKSYCKVSRGIATGANEYFSFNLSKSKEFRIKQENLLPCICKSSDITTLFFEREDLDNLIRANKKVFLIDLQTSPDEHISSYIAFGLQKKIHEKFLTKNRKPWYALENKKPADIWVTVFNRTGIKFIANSTEALNLTTFHGVYIASEYKHFKDVIFAYFLTDLAKEIFSANRREYGNGLSKFEPNDFNNCDIFDFKTLSSNDLVSIRGLLASFKAVQHDLSQSNSLLVEIDDFFRSRM